MCPAANKSPRRRPTAGGGPAVDLYGHDLRWPCGLGRADDGRLEVAVIGGDNSLYSRWQVDPARSDLWANWAPLGGREIRAGVRWQRITRDSLSSSSSEGTGRCIEGLDQSEAAAANDRVRVAPRQRAGHLSHRDVVHVAFPDARRQVDREQARIVDARPARDRDVGHAGRVAFECVCVGVFRTINPAFRLGRRRKRDACGSAWR
jgi:hypothetical protein